MNFLNLELDGDMVTDLDFLTNAIMRHGLPLALRF
jgi:hypothetical protein